MSILKYRYLKYNPGRRMKLTEGAIVTRRGRRLACGYICVYNGFLGFGFFSCTCMNQYHNNQA